MNWFWSGFWPNLASTLIGVIVGLPIALWLNALAGRAATARRQSEDQTRLHDALKAVVAAQAHNQLRLQALRSALASAQALFDVGLDTAAWEAARDQIAPVLRNPELHRRIALHFGRLGTLSRLCSTYLDMVAGIASAIGGVEHTRDALRNHLLTMSEELLTEAKAL